jgi:glutamate synthase domain-containing protein 1
MPRQQSLKQNQMNNSARSDWQNCPELKIMSVGQSIEILKGMGLPVEISERLAWRI